MLKIEKITIKHNSSFLNHFFEIMSEIEDYSASNFDFVLLLVNMQL